MRSQYPILDNRPIDQWKVTELREELRRRKLTTKGLKEDLVRRLDEALRSETELLNEKELNSTVDPEPEPQENQEEKDPSPSDISEVKENANVAVADDETKTFENEVSVADTDDSIRDVSEGTEVLNESMGNAVLDGAVEETVTPGATTEENISHSELTSSKSDANGEDLMDDMENREPNSPTEDTTFNPSEQEKQVSEVSPDLGFQVKCDSISTDSVTINEKIELKDNLNANNFHLELDVGKPEVVQPSSTDVAPVAGDFNSLDNDQEPEDNQGSVEEIDDVTNTASLDLSNKIDNSNGGSPEKLNLDRSSGDESMEEDVLETKQREPSNNSDEVGDTKDVRELHVVKEGSPVDAVVGGLSPDKKDIIAEEDKPVVPAEKRKLEGIRMFY
ncbi:hypothetical protein Taro_029237 [Colocasia esculenta]|uniref:SAP domain-containing protein n=1 Tax=Colocasia esculenta TaxID=4460 RepID=A0A843VKS8_COLES|nr:hypothetical protein [Colocasia esculenta]